MSSIINTLSAIMVVAGFIVAVSAGTMCYLQSLIGLSMIFIGGFVLANLLLKESE